jgi:hypothetical protein
METKGPEMDSGIAGKNQPRPSRKEWLKARRKELAVLPLWKKPFAYLLRTVQLIAAVAFWVAVFGLSLQDIALSFTTAVVAELLFQLLKGKPSAWEGS